MIKIKSAFFYTFTVLISHAFFQIFLYRPNKSRVLPNLLFTVLISHAIQPKVAHNLMDSQAAKKLLEQVVATHGRYKNTKNLYYSFKSREVGLLIGDYFEHAGVTSFPFYGLRFCSSTQCSLVYCETIGSFFDYNQDKEGNWGRGKGYTENVFSQITLVLTMKALHYLTYTWFEGEEPPIDSSERFMVFYHPVQGQTQETQVIDSPLNPMADEEATQENTDEEEVTTETPKYEERYPGIERTSSPPFASFTEENEEDVDSPHADDEVIDLSEEEEVVDLTEEVVDLTENEVIDLAVERSVKRLKHEVIIF